MTLRNVLGTEDYMITVQWHAALQQYLVALRAAHRSPGTIRLHNHYVNFLARYAPVSPWKVDVSLLRTVMAAQTQWSAETRKSARTAWSGFYRWGQSIGAVETNPARLLDPVYIPPPVPRPTPETVLTRLLASSDDRLRFMAMLAAYAGLRAAEISRVHGDDYVDGELRVLGKGRKVRVVPIVAGELVEYLRRVEGWAFPGRIDGHLSPGHVTKLLSEAMPDGWTAHTLRHRMGTRAYAGTRDLLAVGAVLGHTRPETTQRYVRMPDDAVRSAVTAAAA